MTVPTTAAMRDAALSQLTALAQAHEGHRPHFAHMITGLAPHVPIPCLEAFVDRVKSCAASDDLVRLETLLDPLMQGSSVALWGSKLQLQSRAAFATIAEEILVRQEYHFATDMSAPRVIDAGANIGLMAYYVRRMCKASEVICFEPNPDTFAVLSDNAARNKWDNVVLHQAAVAAQDGEAELHVLKDAPLAASLNPRDTTGVMERVTVPTMALSGLLKDPVALLKLDIEGAEADVLEACADTLSLVENIFVEVHPIQGAAPSLLLRVLKVLEDAGFQVHVARSPWSEIAHARKPLLQTHRTYSLSVFGSRRKG